LVLVYFLLGYALYACAFAVAGAMVSRQEDANTTTAPLMIVLVGGRLFAQPLGDRVARLRARRCHHAPAALSAPDRPRPRGAGRAARGRARPLARAHARRGGAPALARGAHLRPRRPAHGRAPA